MLDSRSRVVSALLRGAAALIAVLAVIDPAITTSRRARPLVSVLAVDSVRDRALLRAVVQTLEADDHVVRAPVPGARATVVVGGQLPHDTRDISGPVVVVTPTRAEPTLTIRHVSAPARAVLPSRVTVTVALASNHGTSNNSTRGTVVHVALREERAQQYTTVATSRATIEHDGSAALTFVPTHEGPSRLRVSAVVASGTDTVHTDLVVDVERAQWKVLFFDRRPSWMSTFVRRVVERDPRFVVTSRVVTSTDVSREVGRAPSSLDAITQASAFDAIVVGAPDALTARDADALATMARTRGASVLLLADNANNSPAYRAVGFAGWRAPTSRRTRLEPRIISAPVLQGAAPSADSQPADALRLRGQSVGVPIALPTTAQLLGVLLRDGTTVADSLATPVLWRQPLGRGVVILSGVFDAWRYRDTSQSTFDATWRDLVEYAARQHTPAIDLALSRTLAEPRERIELQVALRDDTRDPGAAPSFGTLSAQLLRASGDREPLQQIVLRADRGAPWAGAFRAPSDSGHFVVRVVHDADTVMAPLVVDTDVARDAGDDEAIVRTWAAAHDGTVIAESALATLPQELKALAPPPMSRVTWHPMRSAWWLLPFALLLSLDWWRRRRVGLP
ncbi:MAG: hypothetical protein IT353_16380 [Gemmatimonadaceae bacterium]|nr:hypothetical protein [Gemmatimonadaceae bacterium]